MPPEVENTRGLKCAGMHVQFHELALRMLGASPIHAGGKG